MHQETRIQLVAAAGKSPPIDDTLLDARFLAHGDQEVGAAVTDEPPSNTGKSVCAAM